MEGTSASPGTAPGRPAGGSPFWKLVAAAVVLLLAGVVGIQAVEHSRRWKAEDEAAERARQTEQDRLDAEGQKKLAVLDAELARKRRLTLVKQENAKHPERFKEFAPTDVVRVLSTAPQADKRGLACAVMNSDKVEDKESGVVWMLRYALTELPLLRADDTICFTPILIAAEHLAKLGSPEEAEDLRLHPALARIAAEQDERIQESFRRQSQIPDLQVGDPVMITDSDPRPSLRGQRGRVLDLAAGDLSDISRIGVATCVVALDSPSVSTVRVKITNLKHAPATQQGR